MEKALDFYRSPGPMTALDEDTHGWALGGLPRDSRGLATAVRGVLVHRDWAPHLGLQFDDDRLADQHIRPARDVVHRVVDLCPQPITTERPLSDRMVAVCRHFAVLHVA